MNMMSKLCSMLRRDYGKGGCGKSVNGRFCCSILAGVQWGLRIIAPWLAPGDVALGRFMLRMPAVVCAWNDGACRLSLASPFLHLRLS